MSKSFREVIADKIKHNRPSLTDSSLKTYVSIVFNLHKKLDPENEALSWFDDDVAILDFLKDKPPSSRKTTLAALYVLTGKSEYNKVMLEDCKHTNDKYKEQTKTKKQEEAWMSVDEIKEIYDTYFDKVTAMFSKKMIADYPTIVKYILLGCLSGASGLPPRRSMDYTEMKVRNYNPDTDNYYKNGVFHFNIYKTAKHYGTQTMDVKTLAPEFNKILKKWATCNENDYMMFSTIGKKLTSPQITKMLNAIFEKKASVDIMRHIYLTNKYGKVQAEMQADARAMANSTEEQALYIKK